MKYEFSYTVRTQTPTGPQDIPYRFTLGDVGGDNVAKAIMFGLNKATGVNGVAVNRIDETSQNVTGAPT